MSLRDMREWSAWQWARFAIAVVPIVGYVLGLLGYRDQLGWKNLAALLVAVLLWVAMWLYDLLSEWCHLGRIVLFANEQRDGKAYFLIPEPVRTLRADIRVTLPKDGEECWRAGLAVVEEPKEGDEQESVCFHSAHSRLAGDGAAMSHLALYVGGQPHWNPDVPRATGKWHRLTLNLVGTQATAEYRQGHTHENERAAQPAGNGARWVRLKVWTDRHATANGEFANVRINGRRVTVFF